MHRPSEHRAGRGTTTRGTSSPALGLAPPDRCLKPSCGSFPQTYSAPKAKTCINRLTHAGRDDLPCLQTRSAIPDRGSGRPCDARPGEGPPSPNRRVPLACQRDCRQSTLAKLFASGRFGSASGDRRRRQVRSAEAAQALIGSTALLTSLRRLCRPALRSAAACPPRKSRPALRAVRSSGIEIRSPRLGGPFRAIR